MLEKKIRVYPIIVEPCDWEAVKWLRELNLRPKDGRPLGLNKDEERTEEQINLDLAKIAKEIRTLLTAETNTQAKPPEISSPPVPQTICPYLGLDAFTENDAHLFFGREEFARDIFQKIQERPFVAVVGPSGSGKSSVVQAGVFPKLKGENTHWFSPEFGDYLCRLL